MSLRDKAREVKAAGVEQRSNFAPHGVPLRIYQWWLAESNSRRATDIWAGRRKENFCHFWRVVLFWAPARKVVYAVEKVAPVLGALIGLASIALILFALVTDPLAVLGFVGGIAAIFALGGGLIAGTSAGMTPENRRRYELMKNKKLIAAVFVLGFPTALLTYVITRAIRYYIDHLTDYNKEIGVALILLVVSLGAVTIGLTAGWLTVVWTALLLLGVVAGGIGVMLALNLLADYISGHRAQTQAKNDELRQQYFVKYGEFPTREPGRVAKFFSGLGDFIVLIAQVVRVNKWKICPIVEVDTE